MVDIDLSKYNILLNQSYEKKLGKVAKVVGLTVESIGPSAKLNDLCHIITKDHNQVINAEVVGFRDDRVLLMPYDQTTGVGLGSRVENTGAPLKVMVGDELLGKVLDGLGNPIDGSGLNCTCGYSVQAEPPDPLTRELIDTVLPLGVKAVDGLITVGKGQRIGIFAGSGVGKSTLMGMFARNTKADINVIALIGERGREVREFIERDLGPEGMKRSVVIVATSDKPALIRKKAAMTATAVAEYFRDQGRDVLLMMDSLTRFSMAQREIGLASGEPPVSRGYPPSVYGEMPQLLERAGRSDKGSITGLYTVLVDGDDFNEPIADTARSILDGHIVLDRKIAQKNHYPAIDDEQIQPDNAEKIYRQVIKKQQYTKKAETLGTYYANMDAAAAAVRLSEMSEDLDLVCDILQNMQEKKAAAILEQMDSAYAAQITKKISAVN